MSWPPTLIPDALVATPPLLTAVHCRILGRGVQVLVPSSHVCLSSANLEAYSRFVTEGGLLLVQDTKLPTGTFRPPPKNIVDDQLTCGRWDLLYKCSFPKSSEFLDVGFTNQLSPFLFVFFWPRCILCSSGISMSPFFMFHWVLHFIDPQQKVVRTQRNVWLPSHSDGPISPPSGRLASFFTSWLFVNVFSTDQLLPKRPSGVEGFRNWILNGSPSAWLIFS